MTDTLANYYLQTEKYEEALREFATVIERDGRNWSFPHARVGYAAAHRQQFRSLDENSVDMLKEYLNIEAVTEDVTEQQLKSRMSANKLLTDHYKKEQERILLEGDKVKSKLAPAEIASSAGSIEISISSIQSEQDFRRIIEDDYLALSPKNAVHIWRTDCSPCLVELPELIRRMSTEPDVHMLVVSTDEFQGQQVHEFLKTAFEAAKSPQTSNIRLYHDPNQYFPKELQSVREQDIGMVPSTIFLQSDQRIGVKVGPVDWVNFDQSRFWN